MEKYNLVSCSQWLKEQPWAVSGWFQADHSLIQIVGPDALEFLHRLCTQDIVGMAVGQTKPAALLSAKGKLLMTCLVLRGATELWVAAPKASAEALGELLERYHFTEKLTIAPVRDRVAMVSIGDAARLLLQDVATRELATLYFDSSRFGITRCLHFAAPGFPRAMTGAELTPQQQEWLRIALGDLTPGIDFQGSTLGSEAAIEDHLSDSKGCYVGQEIVARIATYGHVNRTLVPAWVHAAGVATGTVLVEPVEAEAVGRTTRAADLGNGSSIALALVAREFATPGSELHLGTASGPRVNVTSFE